MRVPTSSTAWVRGVTAMFAAEGLDVPALFAAAGLDAAALEDPEARFSIDDVSRLWELAVARSGKPNLGLSRALAAAHANPGLVRWAMLASPTLRDALALMVRYMNVLSNAATAALDEAADGAWFELGHRGGERPVPRQRVEFGMLSMLAQAGWLTGRELQPLAVEFVYPPPPEPAPFVAAFGVLPRFAAGANRMRLAAADLALALPTRDAAMATLHERLVHDELQRLEGERASLQVRRVVAAMLAEAEPRRERVAVALKLSERTLQRRLQAEGTSFQQVVDDTRRELAQQYLRRPAHTLKQVAALLGFEDQSNLQRACRRWFGESPGRYRERFAPGAPPPA